MQEGNGEVDAIRVKENIDEKAMQARQIVQELECRCPNRWIKHAPSLPSLGMR